MLARRQFLALLGSAVASPALAQDISRTTAYAFSFVSLEGGRIRLADHAGKPVLVVNTASQCGYTPQFTGLQELWKRYHARGLMIVGVPSNEFAQEPGGVEEIQAMAHKNYGVAFPLAAKAVLRGDDAHPFYKWAALQRPGDAPRWNFHKYLVGRDGQIAAVFPTRVEPLDARVIEAIVRELPPE
jgi:glutathione peroxidase